MKNIIVRFTTTAFIVTILCALSISASAAPTVKNTTANGTAFSYLSEDVMPIYDYTSSVIADLSINSGKAEVYGSLAGYPGITDKIDMSLYLQRYENGSWKTIETFSHYRGKIETAVNVDKGYSYRVKGSYYAYAGSNSEHITRYSSTVQY